MESCDLGIEFKVNELVRASVEKDTAECECVEDTRQFKYKCCDVSKDTVAWLKKLPRDRTWVRLAC